MVINSKSQSDTSTAICRSYFRSISFIINLSIYRKFICSFFCCSLFTSELPPSKFWFPLFSCLIHASFSKTSQSEFCCGSAKILYASFASLISLLWSILPLLAKIKVESLDLFGKKTWDQTSTWVKLRFNLSSKVQ